MLDSFEVSFPVLKKSLQQTLKEKLFWGLVVFYPILFKTLEGREKERNFSQ